MDIRIAIPDLVSPSYFPLIAAVELGHMRAQGLSATIELSFPVTRLYERLRNGEVDFVGGAAHAALYAFKDWAGCRLIAALAQGMYWFLVVRSDLKIARGDLQAIRGLRIGAAPGPADGLRRMLVEVGIDPEDEVKITPVPGTVGAGVSFGIAAAAALAEARLDGFWANGMGAEVAVRKGVGTIVLDARRGDGPPGSVDYTFPALVATRGKIDEQSETVAAVVQALAAAQRSLKGNPGCAIEAARPHFPPAELELIPELIRRDGPFYDAVISPDTVRAVNRFARSIGILSAEVPYEEVVATRFSGLWAPPG